MKLHALCLALAVFDPSNCFAQKSKNPEGINVQIEANEWNRGRLLDKLNEQGKKHGMAFTIVSNGGDYRIVFETGKTQGAIVVNGIGGTTDHDTGLATVYNSGGAELFRIRHESFWNEAGAINGSAKEIVKRLQTLRAASRNKVSIHLTIHHYQFL